MLYQKIDFDTFKRTSLVCIDDKNLRLHRVKNSKGVVSNYYINVTCLAKVYNDKYNHLGGISVTIKEPVRVLTAFGDLELKKRQSWGDYSDSLEDKFYIPIDKLLVDSLLITIEKLAIEKAFNQIYKERNEFVFQPVSSLIYGDVVNDKLDIKDAHDLSGVEIFNIPTSKPEEQEE